MHLLHKSTIPVVTFSMLVSEFNVTSIGHLKIDVESHSLEVAQSALQCCLFNPACCPQKITYELWGGNDAKNIPMREERLQMLKHAFPNLQYREISCGSDCVYVRGV